jgi:hypothetical protein
MFPIPDTSGWTDEKVRFELARLDDQGGDENAIRYVSAVEAEAARRSIAFDPYFNANPDVEG